MGITLGGTLLGCPIGGGSGARALRLMQRLLQEGTNVGDELGLEELTGEDGP